MPDRSKDDWLRLCPQLSIGASQSVEPLKLSSETLAAVAEHFWSRGFLQLPPQFNAKDLAPIIAGMHQLKSAGIAPVYIYLFDQPWQLFEKLRPLTAHLLGEDYALLPNFWAWHLDRAGAAGWPLHRDCDAQTVFKVGADKLLMSLSLWLPLTDVDEANGCMYVVEYPALKARGGDEISDGEICAVATPLPAKAGSVLGWPQDVLHFGGTYSEKATNARLSLSFEFQNTAFDPLAEPLLSTRNLPGFETRLKLLADQFDKYRHIDPGLAAG